MAKKDKKDMKRMMLEKLKKAMKSSDKGDMSKVTVMSDSEEGLEKGLSKAQEIMKKRTDVMSDPSPADASNEDDHECRMAALKKMKKQSKK